MYNITTVDELGAGVLATLADYYLLLNWAMGGGWHISIMYVALC